MKVKNSVARKYDRLAAIFDFLENPMEVMGAKKWRKRLLAQVEGDKILEVGVGTGKNFPYYPPQKSVTGIDISKKMLSKAALKAAQLKLSIPLFNMDVQDLKFSSGSFDAVVSTFVFCSVADPDKGLQEIKRVLKPGGKIFFLEHVRPQGIKGRIFDFLNPLFFRLLGNNINRRTARIIKNVGLRILHEEDLFGDVFKFIKAERA
ncbi:MAG: class I SAM-dependent methyltransferase [Thermodesulfobacteriota bacterium]